MTETRCRSKPTPRLLRVWRCLRLLLHFAYGMALVATVQPWLSDSRRLMQKQRWSRRLLEILGVRLDVTLSGIEPASLIVANHISWLDIYALNAARPMAFVAKDDVRCWPLVGWLARHTDTVFLRRGSRAQIRAVNAEIGELLAAGKDVTLFPEGTTTDGTQLLDFHPALLQPAVAGGRPLQPVAIAYFDAAGWRSVAPAYSGETTLWQSLAAVLACRQLTVRLRATPPLATRGTDRRQLAPAARAAIAYRLGLPLADKRPAIAPAAGARQPVMS